MKKCLFAFILSSLFYNCGQDQNLINSEDVALRFFKGIKGGNEDLMKKYYPNISIFESYYKSDSIKINDSRYLNDSLILVSVMNYFTNSYGKMTTKDIDIYFLPDSLGLYSKISDSKGLSNQLENELYSFGINTGIIKNTDTTDVQINRKYFNASLLSYKFTLEKLLDFKTNVNVIDWSWRIGYGSSASGKGIVKNNTTYDIPNVRYEIAYKDRLGNELTTDHGYISYDVLRAGASKSFSFYTSYVSNQASKASISLEFDEDMIKEYVLKAKYNGDEYDKFIAQKNN